MLTSVPQLPRLDQEIRTRWEKKRIFSLILGMSGHSSLISWYPMSTLGIIQVWKIMQSFSHNSTIDPESTDTITNHNTHIFTIHYITSHIWVAIKQVWSVDGISSNQMDWRKSSRVVSSFHIRWAFKPRTSGGNYWVSATTTIALLITESITSPGGLWKLV